MCSLTIQPRNYNCAPESLASLVGSLGGKVQSFEGAERRVHARYVVAIPAIVQPLDDGLVPQGRVFNAATRDISIGGIGLLHTQPVDAYFLGVRLLHSAAAEVPFLVKVLRCRPMGAYFDVAGQFVTTSDECYSELTNRLTMGSARI